MVTGAHQGRVLEILGVYVVGWHLHNRVGVVYLVDCLHLGGKRIVGRRDVLDGLTVLRDGWIV